LLGPFFPVPPLRRRADLRTILAIDSDKHACATYRANVAIEPDRVLCAMVGDCLEQLPYADIVTGGFPCQPHSFAGKREASADARDGGDDFIAAIAKVRPRMFLGENVPGVLSSEGGKYVQRFVAALEAIGYVVEVKTLDAVNFGVPQFRARVWFWGIRRDVYESGVSHRWPSPTHVWPHPTEACMFGGDLLPAVTVGQALGLGLVHRHTANPNSPQFYPTTEPAGTQLAQKSGDQFYEPESDYAIRRNRGKSVVRRDHPVSEPAPTLTDGSGGSGGIFQMIQSHADPARTINAPAPALRSGGSGHDGCCVRIMRNSAISWRRSSSSDRVKPALRLRNAALRRIRSAVNGFETTSLRLVMGPPRPEVWLTNQPRSPLRRGDNAAGKHRSVRDWPVMSRPASDAGPGVAEVAGSRGAYRCVRHA